MLASILLATAVSASPLVHRDGANCYPSRQTAANGSYIDTGCGHVIHPLVELGSCLRTAWDAKEHQTLFIGECKAGGQASGGGRFDFDFGPTEIRFEESTTDQYCILPPSTKDNIAAKYAELGPCPTGRDYTWQVRLSSPNCDTSNGNYIFRITTADFKQCLAMNDNLRLLPCDDNDEAQKFEIPDFSSVAMASHCEKNGTANSTSTTTTASSTSASSSPKETGVDHSNSSVSHNSGSGSKDSHNGANGLTVHAAALVLGALTAVAVTF